MHHPSVWPCLGPVLGRFCPTLLAVAVWGACADAVAIESPLGQQPQPWVHAHAEAPPYAGPTNHAQASPTFRWGWFGAEHFYPSHQAHRDYNGDVLRWSRWRRY